MQAVIAATAAAVAAALAVLAAWELAAAARPRRVGRRRPALAIAAVRLLVAAGRRLRPARAGLPRDLPGRVAAAGAPGGLGVREVMAAKAGAAAAAGTVGLVAASPAPGRLGIAVLAAAPLAGFLAPDVWLARRARERALAARRELPSLLDLLRVTLEAGLPLGAALGSVGRRSSGPVGREWRAAAAEVDLGVPLGDALAGVARRLPLPEVETLTTTLARAARHGTPLAEPLAAHARDGRLAERRRIQEHAARAAPKIQLVVALLLVPSVLLMVGAALLRAVLGTGAVELR